MSDTKSMQVATGARCQMPADDRAAAATRCPGSSSTHGITRRGIEVLAKSIYRELCDRGCRRSDVIRLATALLDQLVTHRLEQRVVNANRAE